MADSAPEADLDLRLVRYFTVVAEHRHFGRAAAALHLAQPSLQPADPPPRAAAGARLLDRTPQGSRLTEAGEVFLPARQGAAALGGPGRGATRAAAPPSRITVGYTGA